MPSLRTVAALVIPFACAAALEQAAASAGLATGAAERATSASQWMYQLAQGPGKERGTITFGPVTAIYEGESSRDVRGVGGGPYDMEPNRSTSFGQSNLGERVWSDKRRVVITYLDKTFSVLKPGDSLVVGGKTYVFGNGTATIRFGRGGKVDVVITPAAEAAGEGAALR